MNQETIDARRYVPKDSQAVRFDDLPGAVVYLYGNGTPYAIGYRPRAFNSAFHHRFSTAERRDKVVATFFDGLRETERYKAERKAERKVRTAQGPADLLRAKLKAAGFNARRVTVRHDHFSMGSSIDVTIRDPDVSRETIKKIASEFESISRCSITGEILSGGNTYQSVNYSDKATATLRDRVRGVVVDAIARVRKQSPDTLEPIDGLGWSVCVPRERPNGLQLWSDRPLQPFGRVRDAYNEDAAVAIVAGA